jgi:hypothetical protein
MASTTSDMEWAWTRCRLFGLRLVYAIAFQLTSNLLVLWPLLTPLGSFFANVDAGDIDLPWASILGFLDVAAVMATSHRHRSSRRAAGRK